MLLKSQVTKCNLLFATYKHSHLEFLTGYHVKFCRNYYILVLFVKNSYKDFFIIQMTDIFRWTTIFFLAGAASLTIWIFCASFWLSKTMAIKHKCQFKKRGRIFHLIHTQAYIGIIQLFNLSLILKNQMTMNLKKPWYVLKII